MGVKTNLSKIVPENGERWEIKFQTLLISFILEWGLGGFWLKIRNKMKSLGTYLNNQSVKSIKKIKSRKVSGKPSDIFNCLSIKVNEPIKIVKKPTKRFIPKSERRFLATQRRLDKGNPITDKQVRRYVHFAQINNIEIPSEIQGRFDSWKEGNEKKYSQWSKVVSRKKKKPKINKRKKTSRKRC